MQAIAVTIAKKYGIDAPLVLSVCHHESNWDPWAVRFEPAFFDRYISSMKLLSDTEKTERAFSFGLMQVLGQVAREFGFTGKYLTELCEPAVGIEYGCRKLAKCLKAHNGAVTDALLSYNGGAYKEYPEKVLQHYDHYKGVL